MAVAFTYVALASYNVEILTHPIGSVENLVDECGQIAEPDWKEKKLARTFSHDTALFQRRSTRKGRKGSIADAMARDGEELRDMSVREKKDWRRIWSEGTDAVMDVPVGGVCEILYGDDREAESDNEDTVL